MKYFLLTLALPMTFSMSVLAAEDCVTVELEERSTSSINAKKLCVGDEVFSMQTKQMAKITEIDQSAKELDKKAAALFLIKDENGKSVRVIDDEIVMNKKSLCMTNLQKVNTCVGDKYIGISDGKEHTITGFTLPTEKKKYAEVLTKEFDGSYKVASAYTVFDSVKATQTGLIFAVGSCTEGMLPTFESSLKKCALKNMAKQFEDNCGRFSQGKGKAIYDLSSKDIKLECSKEYSMIGTSTKSCVASGDLKCERVADVKKDLEETAKMVIDTSKSVNAGASDAENKISNSARGQVKEIERNSTKESSSGNATLSK